MSVPVFKQTRQCGSKLRYDLEVDARLGLVEHHGKKNSVDLNVYFCPHCEFWHVGHSIKEKA